MVNTCIWVIINQKSVRPMRLVRELRYNNERAHQMHGSARTTTTISLVTLNVILFQFILKDPLIKLALPDETSWDYTFDMDCDKTLRQ